MNILVLDPAASTGYCIIEIKELDNKKIMDIIYYDYLDIETSSLYSGDWCIDFEKKLNALIEKYNINDIAFEDYFFSTKYKTGCNMNVEYRTVIKMVARKLNLNYDIVNIIQWKTYIAGRSTPTKEQKKMWPKLYAKKLFIQEALWNEYKIKFPNHSISKLNNKPIAFRMDIVDVIGIGIFHCRSKYKIDKENVIMSMPLIDNYEFKKKPKNIYIYN